MLVFDSPRVSPHQGGFANTGSKNMRCCVRTPCTNIPYPKIKLALFKNSYALTHLPSAEHFADGRAQYAQSLVPIQLNLFPKKLCHERPETAATFTCQEHHIHRVNSRNQGDKLFRKSKILLETERATLCEIAWSLSVGAIQQYTPPRG